MWNPLSPNTATKQIKAMNVNFGPQHPAAHGVLRLILQLNGEIVEKLDTHIGLLHRGTEKLLENKLFLQGLPYFDRLDYVSMMAQEHAYCLGIETIINTFNHVDTINNTRTIYDELTRILNHLLAIACHALDVGSMSSVFWAFEEREKIMEFYERISGARMHAAFYRPTETISIDNLLIEDIIEFCRNFFTTLNEMHNVLTYNKIWKQRLIGIGSYSYTTAITYGLTGVMARCTGLKRDLRLSLNETYANYYYLNFRSFTGLHGDCYDRFLIRMNEMAESLNIITQCINKYWTLKNLDNINVADLLNYTQPHLTNINQHNNMYNSMETLIKHFKSWSEGSVINSNFTYSAVESPKGEFGVFMLTNNTNKPYKCKIRSPAYHHLQVLPIITKGHFLADLVAMIGTIDIVFGEIDR